MEQRVLNTRTVRTIGANGLENFTTVVLDSLHYESHLICTNCGPLGLKADVEPSTNRAALSDRSWAHIVHSNDDHEVGDVDFDVQKCSDDVKQQVNRYRVLSSLVAYVLIFIKHIPSCQPNLSYANLLCNKWYEILWTEYNLPRPSKRKKIKLRMMLELFAVESAVFEKFGLPESGIDFPDMRPDEQGHLSPFCIEQLVDVVCSLQRCLDHEAILNAWSHSLDHSPATVGARLPDEDGAGAAARLGARPARAGGRPRPAGGARSAGSGASGPWRRGGAVRRGVFGRGGGAAVQRPATGRRRRRGGGGGGGGGAAAAAAAAIGAWLGRWRRRCSCVRARPTAGTSATARARSRPATRRARPRTPCTRLRSRP